MSDRYEIHDLASDRTHSCAPTVPRDFAVVEAHARDSKRVNEFHDMVLNEKDWRTEFDLVEGDRTFSCGDWAVLKEGI